MRAGRAVRPDRRRRALRRADRRAPRALERVRSGEDRPGRRRPRGPLRVPPRLPGQRARPRLRRTSCGPAASPRAASRPSTRTSSASPRTPGKLALQYWFFYPFNDFNNTHEGDWEMIQLVFDADDARAGARDASRPRSGTARTRAPSGPTGDDEKLDLVDGTHPGRLSRPPARTRTSSPRRSTSAARPRRASAATTPAARTASSGRASKTIPSDAAAAGDAFPWITFEGRWGELQKAFFNGPTGPNLKTQWTTPIEWSEGWRDRSYAVPTGGPPRHGRDRPVLLRRRAGLARR